MRLLQKLIVVFLLLPFWLQAAQVFDAKKQFSIESASRINVDSLLTMKGLSPYVKIALGDEDGEAFVTVQYSSARKNSLEALHDVFVSTLINVTNLTTKETEMAGFMAYESEFSIHILGFDLSYITVAFIKDDRHYLLMGWSSSEKYDSYKEELKNMIYSFKFA